ncbi:MarR family winged helix-turn-helix transcriptional regulator [Camelimonas sp. ID_303_24]
MSKPVKTAGDASPGAPASAASRKKSGKARAAEVKTSEMKASEVRSSETRAPQAKTLQDRPSQTKALVAKARPAGELPAAPRETGKPVAKAAARGESQQSAASVEPGRADAPVSGQAMHKSVGWALTVLARVHRVELGERLAALGLFPGQEQLLQALHDHQAMTMGALAELMRVRPPTASKAVARLTAQGLVERAGGAAGDGRLVRVRLTEEGYRRAATLAAIWSDAEQRLLAGFDPRERKKLRKFLRRAADNFHHDQEGGAPANGQDAPADNRAP